MWLSLDRGARHKLKLSDRHHVAAPSSPETPELVVRFDSTLIGLVTIATERVVRLSYTVETSSAHVEPSDGQSLSWLGPSPLPPQTQFEIMLTERGSVLVPDKGSGVSNPGGWGQAVPDTIRALWPYVPEDAAPGTEWSAPPAAAGTGGGSRAAGPTTTYRVQTLSDAGRLLVSAEQTLTLTGREAVEAQGHSELQIHLQRDAGLLHADRHTKLWVRPSGTGARVVFGSTQVERPA